MDSDFDRALQELQSAEGSLTARLLSELSDLTRAQCDALVETLNQLVEPRRREIIGAMVSSAEANIELDFVCIFRRLLSQDDPLVRRYAIEGLWEYEGPDLVPVLVRLLSSDPDAGVRAAAAIAVGRFLFMAECDEIDARYEAMIREALERAINDPDEDREVARRAIESIAYINDDGVRRIIDRAYESGDPRMQESAVFAMGRSADSFWADTVLSELYSRVAAMRYEAARAAGELQLRRAVNPLIEMIESSDTEVQSVAIWSLGQIGGNRAQQALEKLVQGDDEVLAEAAAEALDEIEFSSQPMELFVHELDGTIGQDVDTLDDENEDEEEDEPADDEDEAWNDDFLDVG